ncbi:uncharacterized protein LOC129269255 [Lytechinus pictus]|uniref:uncharacterized protein LOC129269255 n=1 Tax=Lytechinus pictus TaxID=7653 RepID=UPI0030B9B754
MDSSLASHVPLSGKSPQLRFKKPEETEQWLLSREKTDYTYSRSASYSSSLSQTGSLRRLANSYDTPIMSRNGQDESELLPQTPHSTQPSHRYATRSSARRSNRLAGQHEGQYENTPTRGRSKSRTRQVPKTAMHMFSDEMQDSNVNGETYSSIHETSISDRSGVISDTSHRGMMTRNNQKNRSLHMYGLDGNESDYSESDIISGGTSTTTITTITTTTSTTWLQQQGNRYHKQMGVFPVFMSSLISVLVVIETIVRTVVSKTITVVKSSSSSFRSKLSSAGYSLWDLLLWLLSCLWMLGRKVAGASRSLWYNPWFYSFRRAPITTLQHGPQYRTESEMYATGGDYTETTTTTTTTTILEEEERRRRRGIPLCCFCLPLLLLLLVASAATSRYFLFPLIARNETNETKGESSLHPINQQFISLQERINYWFTPSSNSDQEPPNQGAFVAMAGVEGCIKCLKQDQLMGWIDSAVKREVAELRMQLNSQKDKIVLLQELRGRQSKEIQALQTQLTDTIAINSASAPNKATIDLISSLESQISDLKAGLRMLQLKVDSSATEQTDNLSPATISLRKDFTTLTGSLAELRGSLQRLHTKCLADAELAKSSNRQCRGDISSLNANMLTLSQKIAEVQSLELTLVQVKREMETFSQTDGHHSMQLSSVVENINSVEASLTAIRKEMRDIELNTTDAASHSGTSASHLSALYEDMSVLRQDMTDMKMKHVGYEGSIEGLANKHTSLLNAAKVTETDLSELRTAVNQLMSTDMNSILERLSQLQTRLNGLEKDSSQLQLNLNTWQASRTVVQGEKDSTVNTEAINILQANLNKLGSQFASLQTDIASIQLKVTELKTSMSQTTQTADIHSAKLLALSKSMSALEKSLNGSVVMLSEAEGASHSLISIRDMNVLKEEMDAVHVAIGKLKNDLAGETASGITIIKSELTSLSGQLEHLEGRLDEVKLEASLANLDGAVKDVTQGQVSLQNDVVRLQFNTDLIKKQTSRANGDAIQLSVLETRLNDLATSIQVLQSSRSSAAGAATGSTCSQNIDFMKGDIIALRQTLSDINAILFAQDSSDKSTSSFLASIQDRLGALDAALAALKISQDSRSDDLAAAVAGLQMEMDKLGLGLERLDAAQKESSGGIGVAAGLAGASLGGAAYDDDISKLKANVSQLQQQYAHLEVDVINCCKNKTGAAGMPWFFPFISTGGSGEAGGTAAAGGSLDEARVKSIVINALDMYNADKTGMVDYALESAGGSIISIRCSETYAFKTALFSLFGIPLWYLSNSPRTVIQPDVHPGNCWAFKGTQGYIVIQLASTIKPTAFSMEHIPKALDPAGVIDSAPKNFTVWGLRDEYDHDGYLLGSYVYDVDGSPLQFFPVQNKDSGPIPFIELKIGSNHGNMEYTCLYRFRVHGVLHR